MPGRDDQFGPRRVDRIRRSPRAPIPPEAMALPRRGVEMKMIRFTRGFARKSNAFGAAVLIQLAEEARLHARGIRQSNLPDRHRLPEAGKECHPCYVRHE